MQKLVNFQELTALVSMREYQSKSVEYGINLSNELSKVGINTVPKFKISSSDGDQWSYEYYMLMLVDAPQHLELFINKREHEKQYSIWTYKMYEYCDNQECERVRRDSGLIEPKNIGVPTVKKVADWVNYYTKLHELYAIRAQDNKAQIDSFIAEIKEFEKNNPVPKHNTEVNGVRWYNDGLSGWVVKNGIEFRFEIHKGSGYIGKQMKIATRVENTFSEFLKLGDNVWSKQ